jgi:predicted nucleic acid-binding Zn ribbon protein
LFLSERPPLKRCLHIGGILSELLEKHRIEGAATLSHIRQLWGPVVGISIAENAQPVAYRKGILFVNVTSTVWIQQLQFLKDDLRVRLEENLDGARLKEIKFKIGPFPI